MTTRPWRVLALLSTAFFMTVLDGTSLLAALPSVERALHLAGHTTPWLVTAYALAFSGPLLLCGRAADLLGRRRMLGSRRTETGSPAAPTPTRAGAKS